MKLKKLVFDITVCKLEDVSAVDLSREFFFLGKTDEEIPSNTIERDDGWRGFRIEGVLDFSLIGILSKISSILAENKIGIFAVSTYNTDYILVKKENFDLAMTVLAEAGYEISE